MTFSSSPAASNGASQKKTLLIVTPYFPPALGGLEQYAVRLTEQLSKCHNWRVVVVTSGPRNGKDSYEVADGYAIYRLSYRLQASSTPLDVRWLWRVRSILKRERPDIVNVHLPVPGLADVTGLMVGDIPLVATYHTVSMRKGILLYDIPIWAYERIFAHVLLRKASRIVCASPASRDFLKVYSQKSLVIPPAVNAELFSPGIKPLERRLLFVGNMSKANGYKGLSYLLEALANPTCQDIFLDVVGEGNARLNYEAQCTRLGISSRVTFHGQLHGADLADRYRASYALVQPSTIDNLPITIIEAMATGLPVIASRVGSIPSIVDDGVNGYLVEPGDVSALVEAITALCSDPIKAADFGKSGRAQVESFFTVETQGDRTNDIFEQILKESSLRQRS